MMKVTFHVIIIISYNYQISAFSTVTRALMVKSHTNYCITMIKFVTLTLHFHPYMTKTEMHPDWYMEVPQQG